MDDACAAVGLVGLGTMGGALARRLAACGVHVVATSRSAPSRERLAGCTDGPLEVLAHPAAVTTRLAQLVPEGPLVVLVSVTGGKQVRAVVEGGACGAGLLDGVPPGRRLLLVDTGTCAPQQARALAAQLARDGHRALDAPVCGGPDAVAAGRLTVMAGGDEADLAAARPALDRVASKVVHCGGPGAGQVTKAAGQLLAACTVEAVAEALALAAGHGVDPSAARTALLGTDAGSGVLDLVAARMIAADFRPGAAVSLFARDLAVVTGLADEAGVPTPAADAVRQQVERLACDAPDVDHSALVTLVAPAGLEALAERARR